jgi:hypothetical protein
MPKRPTARSKPSRQRASTQPARSKRTRTRRSAAKPARAPRRAAKPARLSGKPARAPRRAAKPARSKPARLSGKPARPAPAASEEYTQEYREYLERHALTGHGRPRLRPAEFEKLDNELIDLLTIQSDIGALSDDQVVRLQELEYLLLESES